MANPMTLIHLVRHGQVHNPEKILYGRLPGFRLSDIGREQARAVGAFFKDKPLAAVFSSPLLRARQTAEEIVRHHSPLKQRTTALLNEVCTPFEGKPGRLIDARHGDVYTSDRQEPCFEQPADIVQRVDKFFALILKTHAGVQVAAVTHGDVIVFTLLKTLGLALTPANKNRLKKAGFAVSYPATASITTLVCRGASASDRFIADYVVPYE
jgi:broad specificity phosphatase PhoE